MKRIQKLNSIFVLLFLLSLALPTQSQSCTSLPRIPSYLGKGYDIVMGNPMSNGVDPGFRYEVITFDYTGGLKTEDNAFLVPDSISYQKSQSCSYSADVSEYRGTQSYQNQLKTLVTIGGGYSGVGFKAAFSASFGYKSVESKTQSEETVVFQATSECQNYKLALDRYKAYRVSQNFFRAIEESYSINNWDSFIAQYGTHYTTQVVFGGRAIQDTQFTRTSVSELNSKGIDIKVAAKVGYAGYYGSVQSSTSLTTTQLQQVESSKKKVSNYYIGGIPPKTGNIVDWQVQVNSQPMPIIYNISPLSDLFSGIPNKSTDWITAAKAAFHTGIDNYCAGRCQIPSPDKPLPVKTATLYSSTSTLYGGSGGSDFYFNQYAQQWHVIKVIVKCGSQIDAIQIQLGNPSGQTTTSPYFGGTGGSFKQYSLTSPTAEYFSQIQTRSGSRVDALNFWKSSGSSSGRFGGSGGSSKMVYVPTDYKWTGIIGKSGSRLDKIGFVFTKTVYTYTHKHLSKETSVQ